MLTSALKGVDEAVFRTIEAAQDGSFAGGGNAVFGLDRDGVGLGTVSPRANDEDVAKVDAIKEQLANGEVGEIPTSL